MRACVAGFVYSALVQMFNVHVVDQMYLSDAFENTLNGFTCTLHEKEV